MILIASNEEWRKIIEFCEGFFGIYTRKTFKTFVRKVRLCIILVFQLLSLQNINGYYFMKPRCKKNFTPLHFFLQILEMYDLIIRSFINANGNKNSRRALYSTFVN